MRKILLLVRCGTVIGKTRVYGFSYEDGTRDTSFHLRVNVADTTLYTKLAANV